ncbi:MAG: hypothetical protein KC496_11730 [Anaerolineae bacterium]|nr:hypothetical protein [Anaerolineae bacterium]
MARIRQIILIAALFLAAFAVVLLLNFTAPNPTGRRYSTEAVDLSLDFRQKGQQGEQVLAHDLGVPLTNNAGNRTATCVCNAGYEPGTPPQCSVCTAYSSNVANYRIPDVTADTYFAESKNVIDLVPINTRDYEQLLEISAVAQEIGYPLWIYVRVNTVVDPAITELAQKSGGDVIYYFAVPGYVDPVDQLAGAMLVICGVVIGVAGMGELLAYRRRIPARPTDSPSQPDVVMKQTIQVIVDTEDYINRLDRLTRKPDEEK